MIIEPAEHRNGAPSNAAQPNGREKTKEAAGKKKKAAEEEDDGEDEDSEGQVDEQTKEDDELCEKFTQVEMFELTPLEQGRIFEAAAGALRVLHFDLQDLRAFTRYRATPLGVDRFHRRWWARGRRRRRDAEAPLMMPPRKKFHTYDVSTEALLDHMRVLLNGTYPAPTAPVRWFHIDSVELLDRAIGALAEKGVRESDLKAKVNDVREAAVALIEAAADRR
ncbi:hypothetical protein M3Y99_01452000 [Aphelenchoides fujianensis]|nr:hypothetical protein M3Y99_01452000 [Aphelenchoides fujianensis]